MLLVLINNPTYGEQNEANALTAYQNGNLYSTQKQYEKAIHEYKKALASDPEFIDAHYALANIYYNAGRYDSSREEFKKIVELSPREWIAFYYMGRIDLLNGNHLSSIDNFKKVLRIHTGNENTFANLIKLAKEQNFKIINSEISKGNLFYIFGITLSLSVILIFSLKIVLSFSQNKRSIERIPFNLSKESKVPITITLLTFSLIYLLVRGVPHFFAEEFYSKISAYVTLWIDLIANLLLLGIPLYFLSRENNLSLALLFKKIINGQESVNLLKKLTLTILLTSIVISPSVFIALSILFKRGNFITPWVLYDVNGNLIKFTILTLISSLLVSPFCEEFFFRGVFYNILKQKINARYALIFSSIIFAIYHLDFNYLHIIGRFVFGLFFCFIYEKTRSITYSVIAHSLVNIPTFFLGMS